MTFLCSVGRCLRVEGKKNKTEYSEDMWSTEADSSEDIRVTTKGRDC